MLCSDMSLPYYRAATPVSSMVEGTDAVQIATKSPAPYVLRMKTRSVCVGFVGTACERKASHAMTMGTATVVPATAVPFPQAGHALEGLILFQTCALLGLGRQLLQLSARQARPALPGPGLFLTLEVCP